MYIAWAHHCTCFISGCTWEMGVHRGLPPHLPATTTCHFWGYHHFYLPFYHSCLPALVPPPAPARLTCLHCHWDLPLQWATARASVLSVSATSAPSLPACIFTCLSRAHCHSFCLWEWGYSTTIHSSLTIIHHLSLECLPPASQIHSGTWVLTLPACLGATTLSLPPHTCLPALTACHLPACHLHSACLSSATSPATALLLPACLTGFCLSGLPGRRTHLPVSATWNFCLGHCLPTPGIEPVCLHTQRLHHCCLPHLLCWVSGCHWVQVLPLACLTCSALPALHCLHLHRSLLPPPSCLEVGDGVLPGISPLTCLTAVTACTWFCVLLGFTCAAWAPAPPASATASCLPAAALYLPLSRLRGFNYLIGCHTCAAPPPLDYAALGLPRHTAVAAVPAWVSRPPARWVLCTPACTCWCLLPACAAPSCTCCRLRLPPAAWVHGACLQVTGLGLLLPLLYLGYTLLSGMFWVCCSTVSAVPPHPFCLPAYSTAFSCHLYLPATCRSGISLPATPLPLLFSHTCWGMLHCWHLLHLQMPLPHLGGGFVLPAIRSLYCLFSNSVLGSPPPHHTTLPLSCICYTLSVHGFCTSCLPAPPCLEDLSCTCLFPTCTCSVHSYRTRACHLPASSSPPPASSTCCHLPHTFSDYPTTPHCHCTHHCVFCTTLCLGCLHLLHHHCCLLPIFHVFSPLYT